MFQPESTFPKGIQGGFGPVAGLLALAAAAPPDADQAAEILADLRAGKYDAGSVSISEGRRPGIYFPVVARVMPRAPRIPARNQPGHSRKQTMYIDVVSVDKPVLFANVTIHRQAYDQRAFDYPSLGELVKLGRGSLEHATAFGRRTPQRFDQRRIRHHQGQASQVLGRHPRRCPQGARSRQVQPTEARIAPRTGLDRCDSRSRSQ